MKALKDLKDGAVLAPHVTTRLPDADPERYRALLQRLAEAGVGSDRPVFLVSAPGRSELAGGHTDHNRGKVLAASVQLDSVAAVAPRDDLLVRVSSEGFPAVELDLRDLSAQDAERESTAALIRGVAAELVRNGCHVGGFDAAVSSRVLPGSGLSSSASIEVLVGTLFDFAWNDSAIGPVEIAKAGKIAENEYFGKPSGLMDQVACAHGGIVHIDFKDDENPVIEPIAADFRSAGLSILVVDTGGSHADLTAEYSAIPKEMKSVARALGATELGDLSVGSIIGNLDRVRESTGDRAVSRALHFYAEDDRVERMVDSLRRADYSAYTRLMAESGRSSGLFLQNSAPASAPESQAVVIGMALTDVFLTEHGLVQGVDAASRVQGGGFAGTILVLLPTSAVPAYRDFMRPLLGPASVTEIVIRETGALAW